MTTKVYHYRNSFIDIQTENTRILMDPWVNPANLGAWAGCDGARFIHKSQEINQVEYIYISHLHSDHYDEKFLKDMQKKQKKKIKFIIKKFRDGRLKEKLNNAGFKGNIIEVLDYKKFKLNENEYLVILPQISASRTKNKLINYDLDTSCVFVNNDVALFNQVDNPYNQKNLKDVMKKLKKLNIPKKFDISFMPYCAASEYPQAYINLNRTKEKEKVIKRLFNLFFDLTKEIKTKAIVPAGGTYNLSLCYSRLNKYIAVPSNNDVEKMFLNKKVRTSKIYNNNKNYFIFNKHNIKLAKNFYKKKFDSNIIQESKDPLEKLVKDNFNKLKLTQELNKVEMSLAEFKKNLFLKLKSKIELNIYKRQPLKYKKLKKTKDRVFHVILNNEIKNRKTKLKIHMYYKVLILLLRGKVSWNEMQALCLFEREPNIYEPDAHFWLNLYKI